MKEPIAQKTITLYDFQIKKIDKLADEICDGDFSRCVRSIITYGMDAFIQKNKSQK